MSSKKICRVATAATLLVTVVTGCGATTPPRGELGEMQQLLATCDPATAPAALVEVDGTGSSNSDAIMGERLTVIEKIVRRTAVCSGHLRVTVFSTSSTATTVLFDGALRMDGATDNARLKRVPEAVSGVMEKVRSGYGPAVAALPQSGSDITAQLRLASEWIGQLSDGYRLNLYVLTDGFQNVGVDLGARPLSKQEASALAEQAAVPELAGASVVVAGLGRVATEAPPSALVEGLVTYYEALCKRTTATTCLAVSDYATAGR